MHMNILVTTTAKNENNISIHHYFIHVRIAYIQTSGTCNIAIQLHCSTLSTVLNISSSRVYFGIISQLSLPSFPLFVALTMNLSSLGWQKDWYTSPGQCGLQ